VASGEGIADVVEELRGLLARLEDLGLELLYEAARGDSEPEGDGAVRTRARALAEERRIQRARHAIERALAALEPIVDLDEA
jgi:hypothetical protein